MSIMPMKRNQARGISVLGAFLVFAGVQAAFAADRTWDGGGTNAYWNTVTNWNNNAVPAAGDTVIFASGFGSGTNISLNGDRTAALLEITSTTDFSLNSNVLTLTSGDITRSAASGTTTLNSGIYLSAAALWNITGGLIVNGVVDDGTGSRLLTKSGTGTLALNNSNTFDGGVTLSAGTLAVGHDNALGTGILKFQGGSGTIQSSSSSGYTLDNAVEMHQATTIGGSGALNFTGGFTLKNGNHTLTVSNTALTTFSGGPVGTNAFQTDNVRTLTLDVSSTSGGLLVSGNVRDGGAGDVLTLVKSGGGLLRFGGTNIYTGPTTISAGTLQVGTGGTSGTLGTGNVTNNSALVFSRSNAHTVTNVIAGTGSLTQSGAGTTTLIGANTYSGPTTISAGILQVGNGGTSGTLGGAGNVTNNSALVFNRSNAYTLTNVLYGTGSLTNAGSGTTALLGANLFSGATRVAAGTLILSNSLALQNSTLDYNTGDGTVSFGGNSTNFTLGGLKGNKDLALTNRAGTAIALTVGNNHEDTIYYGVLSGPGRVLKTGTGRLTLAGASTYTNTTTVSLGSLIVNGSLQSKQMTVEAGATLGGTGTVQAVTMNHGATLAVGTATPGTMTFNAQLSLLAGATNRMRVASASSFDVLKGNGANSLSLSGPIVFDFTGNTTVTNGSSFAVFQNWGSRAALGTVTSVGLSSGLSLDTSSLESSGILVVVPEPATGALFGAVTLVAFLVNRRRSLR